MNEELTRYRAAQAGAYLREMRDAKRKIEAMEAEAEELRATAGGLKGLDYSRDAVSGSPTADAIPDAVAAIIEACEKERLGRKCASRVFTGGDAEFFAGIYGGGAVTDDMLTFKGLLQAWRESCV